MAKFCSECGRPLNEGEVCSCTQNTQSAPQEAAPQQSAPQEAAPQQSAPQEAAPQEAAPQQAAPQQSAPQMNQQFNQNVQSGAPQGNQQFNQYAQQGAAMASDVANKVVDSSKSVFAKFGQMFKDPIGTIKEMADENTLKTPMTIVIFNIVVMFLIACIAMITLRLKIGDYAEWISLPYVQAVIVLTLLAAIYDFMLAGCMLLSNHAFFGEKTTFAKMLSVVAGKVLLDTVFIAGAIVLAMVNVGLGVIVFGVGNLLTTILLFMAYNEVSVLTSTKKLYAAFVAYILFIIGLVICDSLLLNSFIDALTEAIRYAMM